VLQRERIVRPPDDAERTVSETIRFSNQKEMTDIANIGYCSINNALSSLSFTAT